MFTDDSDTFIIEKSSNKKLNQKENKAKVIKPKKDKQGKIQYKELSEHFTTLIEGLDEAKKGNLEPIIQEYNSLNESFDIMSTENVEMCHRLFTMEFPEYDNQSDAVKAAFVESMQHDSFHSRYLGDSLYDKMVDAYKLAI